MKNGFIKGLILGIGLCLVVGLGIKVGTGISRYKNSVRTDKIGFGTPTPTPESASKTDNKNANGTHKKKNQGLNWVKNPKQEKPAVINNNKIKTNILFYFLSKQVYLTCSVFFSKIKLYFE